MTKNETSDGQKPIPPKRHQSDLNHPSLENRNPGDDSATKSNEKADKPQDTTPSITQNVIAVMAIVGVVGSITIGYCQISGFEEASRVDLRSYIVIDGVEHHGNAQDSVMLRFTFKNIGKTPAKKVIFQTVIKIGTGIYQGDIDLLMKAYDETVKREKGGYDISQGTPRHLDTDYLPLLQGDVADLKSKRRQIYALGFLTYSDIFDEEQWVRFAIQWDGFENRVMWPIEFNAVSTP